MPIPTEPPTNQQPAINRLFPKIAFIVCAAFSCVAAYLFYAQYWQWRDCFNELGNCFVETDAAVYTQQAGIFWGGLTLALLSLSVFLAYKAKK